MYFLHTVEFVLCISPHTLGGSSEHTRLVRWPALSTAPPEQRTGPCLDQERFSHDNLATFPSQDHKAVVCAKYQFGNLNCKGHKILLL